MKEADYEPEEGEIEDDDGQDDVQPTLPELLGGSRGKSDYLNLRCVPLIRGDLHHRETQSLHLGENIRSLEMEWVSPCNSYPSRSPRFRVNGMPGRQFYNRPCAKEWNSMKPVRRSTLKESRARDTYFATSKLWPSSLNKSLHPHGSTSNLSNSGNRFESVSNNWSPYKKSAKNYGNQKRKTRNKFTDTKRAWQQNHVGRSDTKCDDLILEKNRNTPTLQQPSPLEKSDTKVKCKNETCQENVLSDSSDGIEIIEVPKKEPELITIDGSDDELDNGNEPLSKVPDDHTKGNITNTTSINEMVSLNEENKLPSHSELSHFSQEKCKLVSERIDPAKNIVEHCQVENISISSPEKSDKVLSTQYETIPTNFSSETSTKKKNPIAFIAHLLPPSEELPLQNSDMPVSKPAPANNLIEGEEISAVVGSTNTQLQILDKNEVSTVTNDISDRISATQGKENNTDEKTTQPIIAQEKSNIVECISYLGNTESESKDVSADKNITASSVGHVLSNHFHSDAPKVTQSQYATVYFDRVGANNSKCRKYEEQNYKFSVTVPELIISLGKDSDSGDDSDSKYDNNRANLKHNVILEDKKNILTPAIPVDFEKKLDVLLKEARHQQEENTQKLGENYRDNKDVKSCSLYPTHQQNDISKNIAMPQSCVRVLPSLKNIINLRSGKNKSKNSVMRNSYTTLCHERINGNGLHVKAARRLASKSGDHNNQVSPSFNKRYQSRSKIINQTCLQPGINIGLLSPHKQREYIKLKRKLVQLTHKTKERPGKHEVVASTILSANEKKPQEVKVNKPAIRTSVTRIPRHSVIQKSVVSHECKRGKLPENLSSKISCVPQASNSDINCANCRNNSTTTNTNNTDNSNCQLENINTQPIADCTGNTNKISDKSGLIIAKMNHSDCPNDSNILMKKNSPNSDSNITEQDSVHMKVCEVIARNQANIQKVSTDKSPQVKRKNSSDKKITPLQKKQRTTSNQIKKASCKPSGVINMAPFAIISGDGKLVEQLWSSETRLIAKRRQVLEDIATVRLNLHKMEVVNFKRNLMMEEIQKLKEQLKEADLHLSKKCEALHILDERVGDAKQNIQKCQSELLSLTLECEELGCKVHGPNYNVPNTCADLIRNEMTAMSEAIQQMETQKKPEATIQ